MKRIIVIVFLLFTLCGCNLQLNTFFNTITNENRSYLLVITVNSQNKHILEVDCSNAYAYSLNEEEKENEIYFTNIHDDYKVYSKKDDEWSIEKNHSYYENFFGIKHLGMLRYTFDGTSYVSEYENASFKINLFDTKVTITNTNTNEYVVYKYDFTVEPNVILPF